MLTASEVTGQEPPILDFGVHIGFVPGDSFFSVSQPAEYVEAFSQDETTGNLELSYKYPPLRDVDLALPNYSGFSRASIEGLNESDWDSLTQFKSALYRDTSLLNPENEARVIVVNRDFDWKAFHFLLRYNERWTNLSSADYPEMPREQGIRGGALPAYYQPHVNIGEAVAEDWRDGAKVDGLKFAFPKSVTFARVKERLQIVEPVTLHWRDVQLIGFPGFDTKDIFNRKYDSTFIVVSSDGVSRYRWTTGAPEDEDIKAVVEWTHAVGKQTSDE